MDDIVGPNRPPPFGGPFTPPMLQEIICDRGVLKQGRRPGRAELAQLAVSLNLLCGVFTFAKNAVSQSEAMRDRADHVRGALEVLISFFEERRQECFPKGGPAPSADIVVAEERLSDQFYLFVAAMSEHKFELQMDMDELALMPPYENWRDIAERIAGAFREAMSVNNPSWAGGSSNEGPIPRFVAEIVPMITGESPAVGAVGQFLKRRRRTRK
jgi:hypothetical protein